MIAIAVGVLALAVGSCASTNAGTGEFTTSPVAQLQPQLQVVGIEGTSQAVADTLDVELTPTSAGYDVTVAAGETATAVDELFIKIGYDPAFEINNLITPASDDTLSLAVEQVPGSVHFGAVPVGHASGCVEAGETLLSFSLAAGDGKDASSTQFEEATVVQPRNLDLRQNDEGDWVLSWDYTNPGDTGQDGKVTIADLTPLGRHFLRQVTTGSDEPLRHVDCDSNGEIGLSDLTPIGAYYEKDVHNYKIQMSTDGFGDWITVGELVLSEMEVNPDNALRFEYKFGLQYVSGAYYRVRPQTHGLEYGAPSEAISEGGRRMEFEFSEDVTVVVAAQELPAPLAQMNAVRLIYPANYSYVPDSFNPGKVGGEREEVDGFWATYVQTFLLMPESFVREIDMGDGNKALDFNVSVAERLLPASPAGSGDLFNFQLRQDSPGALRLDFQPESEDGIKRTYYSGPDDDDYWFGNSLGLRVF